MEAEVDGAPLFLFANHWKSGASDPETEPVRIANARTLRTRVDEILAADANADIIIGGDLNSQYNQRQRYPRMKETGINDVLGSQGNELAVRQPGRPLYNLWFELPAARRGSDTYRGEWGTLMHLIISRGLYDQNGVQYVDNSFAVGRFAGLNADADGLPLRWTFDGPAGGGFSDHFPVSARFTTVSEGRRDRWLALKDASDGASTGEAFKTVDHAKVDLEGRALRLETLPAGARLQQDEFKGKLVRVAVGSIFDVAVDIREPVVAPLEAVGEAGVVVAEEVEQCGVEVVHVDRVAGDVVAEVVGFTVHEPRLHAAAGEPHREAASVVVASVVGGLELALAVGRAAELAAPDHQRVLEQAALTQVAHEGRGGLVDIGALQAQVAWQVVMLVPAAVVQLDEAHVALG